MPELLYPQEITVEAIGNALNERLEKLDAARQELKMATSIFNLHPELLHDEVVNQQVKLKEVEVKAHLGVAQRLLRQLGNIKQRHDVAGIKARYNIQEYIGRTVELKQRGRTMVGLCPFHSEKSPSFTVYEDSYYCYGCTASGDILTYIMAVRGCSFIEALGELL